MHFMPAKNNITRTKRSTDLFAKNCTLFRYNLHDLQAILDLVVEYRCGQFVGSSRLWKAVEARKLLKGKLRHPRTWEALRKAFRDKVWPLLKRTNGKCMLHIDEEDFNYLKVPE